jgi:energy-coupling factor transporter ATP-binding protein EcfA2
VQHKIILGRTESDRKKMGDKASIFLGRHYVKMGQVTSLSSNIFMDVARAHIVLVSGKRGSGKSYTLGVMAEEMSNLPSEVSQNLSIVMFDTMGIFWTMKYPNEKEEDLLEDWNLSSKKLDTIDVYIPDGFFEEYKSRGILADYPFSIKTSELDSGDWANVFNVDLMKPIGILIEKVISGLQERRLNYDMKDIIKEINRNKTTEKNVSDATINLFSAAEGWGLFKKTGTRIKDLVKRGRVSIIDTSCYTHVSGSWSIKSLVTGLVSKKLLLERMTARKIEELKSIKRGTSFLGLTDKRNEKEEMPLVWIMIDEAHEFLPREGKSAASDALIQLLREGRQPGISMVLATQQPGEIHKDVMTQSDIVISHRVTARKDITALNDIMQTYLLADIQKYLNNLPSSKGSAIILDDNSERIYSMKVRPRFTWHGGEAPTAYTPKRRELLDLDL